MIICGVLNDWQSLITMLVHPSDVLVCRQLLGLQIKFANDNGREGSIMRRTRQPAQINIQVTSVHRSFKRFQKRTYRVIDDKRREGVFHRRAHEIAVPSS